MAPLAALPKSQSRITLRTRPTGAINPALNGTGTFNIEKDVPLKQVENDEVAVVVEWLSLDPAMRGWLNDSRSYIPPVKLGEVMRSGGVGRVVAVGSDVKDLTVGEWVNGTLGWQEYAVLKRKEVQKVHVSPSVSPSYYLGSLGMPGQTAYWGMLDVAKIQAGETVVVSGAAGATGLVACQIALLKGCKVIAIAGGKDKCKLLKEEIGVHEALDYKQEWGVFVKEFREKVGYLDVYYDNVGGEILDLALTRLKKGARIALCGAISAYNESRPKGLQMYLNLISQRAKIEGFIVFDYAKRYHEADADLAKWVNEGKLKIRETRLVGLDQCVNGLIGLFEGKNTGKMVVKVSDGGAKL
ncbi:NAD(P)-binding protein [Meredithblackwellia eburnea MCA 4105]